MSSIDLTSPLRPSVATPRSPRSSNTGAFFASSSDSSRDVEAASTSTTTTTTAQTAAVKVGPPPLPRANARQASTTMPPALPQFSRANAARGSSSDDEGHDGIPRSSSSTSSNVTPPKSSEKSTVRIPRPSTTTPLPLTPRARVSLSPSPRSVLPHSGQSSRHILASTLGQSLPVGEIADIGLLPSAEQIAAMPFPQKLGWIDTLVQAKTSILAASKSNTPVVDEGSPDPSKVTQSRRAQTKETTETLRQIDATLACLSGEDRLDQKLPLARALMQRVEKLPLQTKLTKKTDPDTRRLIYARDLLNKLGGDKSLCIEWLVAFSNESEQAVAYLDANVAPSRDLSLLSDLFKAFSDKPTLAAAWVKNCRDCASPSEWLSIIPWNGGKGMLADFFTKAAELRPIDARTLYTANAMQVYYELYAKFKGDFNLAQNVMRSWDTSACTKEMGKILNPVEGKKA